LAISDISFDLSIYDLFGLLFTGGKVIFLRQENLKDMHYLAKKVREHRITLWNTVPQLANLIAQEFQETPNNTIRVFLLSGDWIDLELPAQLKKNFIKSKVYSLGGATEGSIWSIWYEIKDLNPEWKSVPYGEAMPNQKMYVLNSKLNHCSRGVEGEIHIGGKGVALNYWRDEQLTKKSFINHPTLGRLYKTGDFGKWNKAGYIEFVGRKYTQLKINGHRIELGEIESRLSELPGIEKAVVTVQSLGDSKHLVGYLVSVIKNNRKYSANAEIETVA
jgi:non-ribosomal peptide synthetase component F